MPSQKNDKTARISPESRKYASFFKTNIFPMLSKSASIHEAQFLKTDLFEITLEVWCPANATIKYIGRSN